MLEDEAESQPIRPRPRRWPAVLLVLIVLALAGGAVWYWTSRGSEETQAGGEPAVRSTLHLEPFVLNLADTETRGYLRVGIDLGLNQELKQATDGAPVAQVRDTILSVLSDAKGDDLITSPGKNKLKQDILRALQERVPKLGAEEVYFTEFLIQR